MAALDTTIAPAPSGPVTSPSFADAVRVFARIGLLSFGGPAGQIALMHRVLVEEERWIDERSYLNALNFCMLLPGPEAMQLATYVGWRLHGLKGGLAAGLLFVLPGAFVVLGLSMIYAAFGKVPLVTALFLGVKAAVLAIVVEALLRISRRSLRDAVEWIVAGLAFTGVFFLGIPFPLIVLAAAAIGFLRGKAGADRPQVSVPISTSRTLLTAALWLAIWILPLAALAYLLGADHVISQIALFFKSSLSSRSGALMRSLPTWCRTWWATTGGSPPARCWTGSASRRRRRGRSSW